MTRSNMIYWKIILRNGGEITNEDFMKNPDGTPMMREVIHDGKPTGDFEPQPASHILVDQSQVAQFLIYNDQGIVSLPIMFPEDEESKLVYRRRVAKNPLTGAEKGYFFLAGKHFPDGRTELQGILPDGTLLDETPTLAAEDEIILYPEEQFESELKK